MVIVIATHAVLGQSQNDEALMKINNSKIDRIIVSNSIPMEESGKVAFLILLFLRAFLDHCGGHVMDLLLSEAMRRIHHGESMSLMFSGVDRND